MPDEPAELTALEAELRRLRPRAPSPELEEFVARRLRPRRVLTSFWAWSALPLGAAAAIALVVASRPPTAVVPDAARIAAPAAAFKPVAADNLLLDTQDEGLVTLDDGTTARRVRSNYLDTVTWKNPRTQASLKWTVPREEIRVVPVIFQ